jgi:hypothetical protein
LEAGFFMGCCPELVLGFLFTGDFFAGLPPFLPGEAFGFATVFITFFGFGDFDLPGLPFALAGDSFDLPGLLAVLFFSKKQPGHWPVFSSKCLELCLERLALTPPYPFQVLPPQLCQQPHPESH